MMKETDYSLRQRIGAALLDWPRYAWRLPADWLHVCNRQERLAASPDGRGVACDWQWTSDLHAPKVFPSLGVRLMASCLRDWPIRFAEAPQGEGGEARLSFIIGHRGRARLPLLLATLSTVAAQRGAAWECIVVEQSEQSELAGVLPEWVRHVHTSLPVPGMPYCRSWAFNVGARAARGAILVFHDNDMLVSQDYASQLWARAQEGWEVVNLKRFIFYLSESRTRAVCAGDRHLPVAAPDSIMQNAEAGGSIAISRGAFFAIGGYDEAFVGWGGEDSEFWQRALTRKVWPYGYLPLVHLWHAPQPDKEKLDRQSARQFQDRSSIPPAERIAHLLQRRFGEREQLDPRWQPGEPGP